MLKPIPVHELKVGDLVAFYEYQCRVINITGLYNLRNDPMGDWSIRLENENDLELPGNMYICIYVEEGKE